MEQLCEVSVERVPNLVYEIKEVSSHVPIVINSDRVSSLMTVNFSVADEPNLRIKRLLIFMD